MLETKNPFHGQEFNGLEKSIQVGRDEYIQIFADKLREVVGLSQSGKKVFGILYDQYLRQNKEAVMMTFEDRYPFKKSTYYSGIKDLLAKQVIAKSKYRDMYYINPAYVQNSLTYTVKYHIAD